MSTTAEPDHPSAEADAAPAIDVQSLGEAFQRTAAQYADDVALRTHGSDAELTWRDYAGRVERVAAGLAAAGVGRGDVVAIMLTNRPEHLLVDTAAMHLGAIPFSIYNTSAPEQVAYLLAHSASGVLVTETQFADRVGAAREQVPALREIVLVDGPAKHGGRTLADVEAGGDAGFDFESAWRAVGLEDVATLIYTSGTTGPPKGVEITHGNLLATFSAFGALHPLRTRGRYMSYLPTAHMVDRVTAHYPSLLYGGTITCVADLRQALLALPEVRPTLWAAVPRVWEKLKAAVEADLAAAGEAAGALAERVAARLGLDDADLLISGAAPVAPEVLEFFASIGVSVYEAYGMSETTALIALAPRGRHRMGTVGKPIPGVQIKRTDDGELLVRGPNVTRGYRQDATRTAEAIDPDGWLHTGDLVEIDADGYLRIIDRKKELIINASGKNMSPTNIENTLSAECSLIGSAMVIGDGRRFNTALITVDAEAAVAFARARRLEALDGAALAAHPDVQESIAAGVERANARLSRVEQIKRYTVIPAAWEPGGDELTPTMKLKRKPIAEKYADMIEAMYVD